jgi:hypothetical protein
MIVRGHHTLSLTRSWAAAPRGLAAVLLVLLLVPLPGTARAQDVGTTDGKASTSLTLSFDPSRGGGLPSYVVARLLAADGSAVIGERVRIRRHTEVFGGRAVDLGRPSTDNAGLARVPVGPREDAYEITASFSGSDAFEASETSARLEFPQHLVLRLEESAPGRPFAPQLQPLASAMPWVIGGGVLVVWIVLAVVVLATLVRIRSEGRLADEAMARLTAPPGRWPAPREHEPSAATVAIEDERREA